MASESDSEVRRLEIATVGSAGQGTVSGDRQRLLFQTLSEAQVDFLLQRTPVREIKYRQGRGGLQFAYVEHGYVTERLNVVFGFNWDFEIVDKQILEDEVIVEARLTVRTPGKQTIVKTQFGGAEIKRHTSGARSGRPVSIADDYKAAASDALKKCASLLGIGLDLYGRDRTDDTTAQPVDVAAPAAPEQITPDVVESTVRTLSAPEPGMCRADQASEITALAERLGMGLAELAQSLHVESVTELTESRAQRVLNRLHELAAGVDEELAS